MERNTPSVWDKVWAGSSSREEDILALKREESRISWQRIEHKVLSNFGSCAGLKVVELGSGSGLHAALMAKRGALVTLIDYSDNALKRASEFFVNNGLKAEFVKADIFSLPSDTAEKFDVSMSFGMAEHFRGPDRAKVTKLHFDVIRKGGLAFVSVPNKWNPPYRIYKFIYEIAGKWNVGEEYPYSRTEFRDICGTIGVDDFVFIGNSLISSFHFISPLKAARKLLNIKGSVSRPDAEIKKESGTPLDSYFSYALILCGKK